MILDHEWPQVALGEIAEVTTGQPAPQEPRYFGGSRRFVRVSHLDLDSQSVVAFDAITDQAVADLRLRQFPKGTIVFPKSGASIRLEKRAMLPFDAYLVSHLTAVQAYPHVVDPLYLFFALRRTRLAAQNADGYPTLRVSDVRATPIPLPPLPEQKAIAKVLHIVQRELETTQQVIAATRELKRSLASHLFASGLETLAGRAAVEVLETSSKPMPARWHPVRGSDLVIDIQSGDWGVDHPAEGLTPARVVRGTDFAKARLGLADGLPTRYLSDARISRRRLGGGDLLVEMSGGSEDQATGRLLLVPGGLNTSSDTPVIFSNFVKRVRFSDALLPGFVRHYWDHLYSLGRTRVYERRTTGIRNFKLDGFLENEQFPTPPREEQRAIQQALDAVDTKIELELQRRDALNSVFGALLRDLLSGRVRVPEEDEGATSS